MPVKKPVERKTPRYGLKPTDLMKAMGSETGEFNPEAPDWALLEMNLTDDHIIRLLGYLKTHQTARNHGSPWAMDGQSKKPILLERVAHDLEWHPENARKYVDHAVELGYVRVSELGWIGLSADVPLARRRRKKSSEAPDDPVENSSLYRLTSPGVHEQIQQLPEAVKCKMQGVAEAFWKWGHGDVRANLRADAMAFARSIEDVIENTILAAGGLEKTLDRREPKDRPRLISELKLAKAFPDFQSVQTGEASVQTGDPGLYKANGRSAQTEKVHLRTNGKLPHGERTTESGEERAFQTTDSRQRVSSSSSVEAPTEPTTTTSFISPEKEQDWILEAFEKYALRANRGQAYRLITVCRQKVPDVGAGEIIDLLIDPVAPLANRKSNPYAYISRCIDERITREEVDKLRAQKKPRERPHVETCGFCRGAGVLRDARSVEWSFVPELVEAVKQGAEFCGCSAGDTARTLYALEPDSAVVAGGAD